MPPSSPRCWGTCSAVSTTASSAASAAAGAKPPGLPEVFRVDLRSVKAARKHLVAIGWLQTFHAPQRLCNRWGIYTRISLSWTRVALEHPQTQAAPPASASPPPATFCTSKLPPLAKENQEPFQELQHQKPAPLAEAAPQPCPSHPQPPPWTHHWC